MRTRPVTQFPYVDGAGLRHVFSVEDANYFQPGAAPQVYDFLRSKRWKARFISHVVDERSGLAKAGDETRLQRYDLSWRGPGALPQARNDRLRR
jgi:hypothetical protein